MRRGQRAVSDEVRTLRRENRLLRRKVASLQRALERTEGGLMGMLARRGMRLHRLVAPEKLLVHPGLPSGGVDRLYALLRRYSFRLLLRDVIRMREGFRPEGLASYSSLRAVRGYLSSLQRLGLVSRDPNGLYRLTRKTVTSFGETLEWYIAELMRREFFAEVIHSASFRMPPPGGDFDVIAAMEGLLVYVEVKSSPPRGIEAEEVAGFLRRREILLPHLAMFLVDTHLRMWDKMVPIVEELLGGAPRDSGQAHRVVQRLEREIFHVGHRLYILNSSRGILSNLRRCFSDHLRRGNPGTAIPGPGLGR
jgi:hypothetical protein